MVGRETETYLAMASQAKQGVHKVGDPFIKAVVGLCENECGQKSLSPIREGTLMVSMACGW